MTELRKLIEAVEAGENIALMPFPEEFRPVWTRILMATNGGSLDAAKDVHDALLPCNWIGHIDTDGYAMVWKDEEEVSNSYGVVGQKCPARAWLIAILKAYEAQQ